MKVNLLKLAFWSILLSIILNIANSSFITYTVDGARKNWFLGDALSAIRLPIVLFPLIIYFLVRKEDKSIKFYQQNWDVLLFALVPWLSIINAFDSVNAILYTTWHTALFILILLFYHHLRVKYTNGQLLLYISYLMIIGNAIVIPFLLVDIDKVMSGTSLQMMYSSKAFYPYCLLTIIVSLYTVLHIRKTQSITLNSRILRLPATYYYLVIILCLFFILGSGRRATLVVSVVITLYFLTFHYGKSYITKFASLILVLIVSLIMTFNISEIIEGYGSTYSSINRLGFIELDVDENTIEETGFSQSYNDRIMVWDSYMALVDKYPFFGVGLYNGSVVHKATYVNWELAGYSTHNTYLGILVESGWLGLICFLLIIGRSIIQTIRAPKNERNILILWVLPALIININEFNSLGGQVFFWSTALSILLPRAVHNNRPA